jgi:uncharacterized protein (DUF302 family)
MILTSRHPYPETIALLEKAITGAGNRIFCTIDQAAAASDAGMTLRPTTLILFGNPKGGTPLMEAFPIVALELPLKLLVWEENGSVSVAYVPASEIAARYGVTGQDSRVDAMDKGVAAIARSVT